MVFAVLLTCVDSLLLAKKNRLLQMLGDDTPPAPTAGDQVLSWSGMCVSLSSNSPGKVLSFCLSACLSNCLSTCPSVQSSFHLSICLSKYALLFVHPTVCPCVLAAAQVSLCTELFVPSFYLFYLFIFTLDQLCKRQPNSLSLPRYQPGLMISISSSQLQS